MSLLIIIILIIEFIKSQTNRYEVQHHNSWHAEQRYIYLYWHADQVQPTAGFSTDK